MKIVTAPRTLKDIVRPLMRPKYYHKQSLKIASEEELRTEGTRRARKTLYTIRKRFPKSKIDFVKGPDGTVARAKTAPYDRHDFWILFGALNEQIEFHNLTEDDLK